MGILAQATLAQTIVIDRLDPSDCGPHSHSDLSQAKVE